MVREDLVSSAVDFLRDPSVAASALDKRIAFLQSKNLTQEEIDISLARAGDGSQPPPPPASAPPQNQYGYQGQGPMRHNPGYGYGYGPYQQGPWSQPPLEPPRRDWRDWFIMATVTSGVGYGLFKFTQQYILPLISPPPPPLLTADKAAIDASFTRAFALIDQLATDTATLKDHETARTQKLDTTLKEIDTVLGDLKAANTRREAEARIVAEQMQGLKEQVPKALEGWKANGDARLEELGVEMQSLRKLLENKVGRSAGVKNQPTSFTNGSNDTKENSPSPPSASATTNNINNENDNNTPTNPPSHAPSNSASASAPAPGLTTPRPDTQTPTPTPTPTTYPFDRSDRKATIPAWQRAAAASSSEKPNAKSESSKSQPNA